MAQTWEDLGGGQKRLTITDDEGRVPPVYVRGTESEILSKLAKSKIEADLVIAGRKSAGNHGLSAGDRMQVVADLQNPGKVDQAITRVVESVIGPVEEIRQDRKEEREERQTRLAMQAATTFAETTPDWHNSEHNKNTLVGYMKRMGLDAFKVEDYRSAFAQLKNAGLLQAKPATNGEGEDETETEVSANRERTAPAPTAQPKAPTRFSTGVRPGDISGQQPKPTNRLKYTREQIENMSAAKMKSLINEPDFVKASEYYAAEDRQKNQRRRAS